MPPRFEPFTVFGVKVSQVKEWLFIGGTVPRDSQNAVMGKNDIRIQILQVFENLKGILREGGMCLGNVVQLNVYLTDHKSRLRYLEFAREIFKGILVPQTILVVRGLHDPDVLIEVDGIACKQEIPLEETYSEGKAGIEEILAANDYGVTTTGVDFLTKLEELK